MGILKHLAYGAAFMLGVGGATIAYKKWGEEKQWENIYKRQAEKEAA